MTNIAPTSNKQRAALPPAPILPFFIKANASQYRKSIGITRIGLALGISVIFWVKLGFLGWLITVIGIAAVIILIVYLLTRRSITVDNESVHYKNPFGIRKSININEIKSVEIFDNYVDPGFGVMPRIILAKKSGGFLFSIIGIFWPVTEVQKLLSALKANKVTLNFYSKPVQSQNIAKEFPNLVPYYERHPYMTAAIGSIVTIVAIIIGIVLFTI